MQVDGARRRRAISSRCSRCRSCTAAPGREAEDDAGARVVVLSQRTQREAVRQRRTRSARRIRMHRTRTSAIVGVLDTWNPMPRYYRLINGTGGGFSGEDEVFIPFTTAIRHRARQQRQHELQRRRPRAGLPGLPQLRVHLDPVLVRDQVGGRPRARCRTTSPPTSPSSASSAACSATRRHQLFDVMEWLRVPARWSATTARSSVWLSFGFLLLCLVNTIGLLLAKFSARAPRGRRAPRARRHAGATIFRQFLIEAGVVGLAGGMLGLVLSFGGLCADRASSRTQLAAGRADGLADARR